LGKEREEDDLEIGVEVADLGNILSLKDLETATPEWKARIIFRGDRPMVVAGKNEDGSSRYQPVSENQDAWACTTADHTAVRVALAYNICKGYNTYTFDLASAYLQADAGGRETYVRVKGNMKEALPGDFKERIKHMKKPVFRLDKALYGRTRSGYDWAKKLQTVLGSKRIALQTGAERLPF